MLTEKQRHALLVLNDAFREELNVDTLPGLRRRIGKNEKLILEILRAKKVDFLSFKELSEACLSVMPQHTRQKRDRRQELVAIAVTSLHGKKEIKYESGIVYLTANSTPWLKL